MTNTPEERHGLGWLPDLPDIRDMDLSLTAADLGMTLPTTVRLDQEPWMPPVYDQGQLGSCTANALAAAVEFDLRKQEMVDFMPSRLFIYYNERVIEKTVDYDAGALIRDGAKTLHRIGVCSESMWPYDPARFTEKPPATAYLDARNTKAVAYQRVSRRDVRHVLAGGTPIVFGFTVYSNFYDIGDNGIMSMPVGDVKGGHAVMLCGYDRLDNGLYFRVRNSWGVDIEDEGYFWMPSEYVLESKLSSDFWSIQTVS